AGVDGVSIQGPMKRLEDPELIRLCKEQGVCMAFTARGSCKLGQQCQYKHDALVRILAGSPVSRSVTVLNSKSLHGFYVEPDTGASHSIITERLAQHLLSSVPGASLHPNDARFDTACSLGSLSSTHRLSVALPVTNGMETFILHWSPSVICNSNLLHSDGLLGMDCMDFDKDALWLRLGDTRLRAAQFFTPPVTPRYDETGYAEDHRLSARRPSTDHTPPHESCQLVRKASPAPYSFDHLGLVSPTFPPAPDGYSVDAVVYENEWLRIYLLKCHGLDDRYEFCVDYSDQLLDTALSHPPRPVQKIHYKLTTAPKEERKEAHDRLIKLIHTKKLVPTAPCDKNTYASNWYPVRGRKKVRPVVPELRANAVLQMVCKRWPIVDCQSKISRLINKFRCYPYYKTLDVADAYRAIRLGDNAQKMCQVYLDSKSFTFAYMCDGTAINPPVLEHIVKFILRRISEDDDFKDIAISYMDDIIQLSGKGDLAAGTELIIKTFAKYNMKLTLSSSPDDPVLGYDVVCGGTKLGYPPKKYNLSINFNITGDLSYGSALSLLGYVTQAPDLLPWHVLCCKNSLVALVSRARAIKQAKWKESIGDETIVSLLERWQQLLQESPIQPIERYVDTEDQLHIWFDASDLLGAMVAKQRGQVVLRRQWRWSRQERSLHINIKEMSAAFNSLSAVVGFELDSGRQFRHISLHGDNKTANAALSSSKVASNGKQSLLLQKTVDLVHCLMGKRSFTVNYCPTSQNLADEGTRSELYSDIVCHRDLLDNFELQPISQSLSPSCNVHVARVVRKRDEVVSDCVDSATTKKPRVSLEKPISVPTTPLIAPSPSSVYDSVQLPPVLLDTYRGLPVDSQGKRVVVDRDFLGACADHCHNLRHTGAPEIAATLRTYFCAGPGLDFMDIASLSVRKCPTCVLVKTAPGDKRPKNAVDRSAITIPTAVFEVMSLDVLGPYQTNQITRSPRFYCVTLVCHLTNLILCLPTITAPTADDIQRACNLPHRTYNQVVQRVRTDNAAVIRAAAKSMPDLKFDFVPVSASWLNGHVEARHRLLNQRLRRLLLSCASIDAKVWFDAVSKAAFEVNTSVNMEADGLCPLDMVTQSRTSPFDITQVTALPANKWDRWMKYKVACKARIAAAMERKTANGSALLFG
ncbi:hypothetical protein FOZ62_027513, partial [Perkinsus olseni]